MLWADDNGPGSDGYYTIDNFRVTVGPELSIRAAGAGRVEVSWPTNWCNHAVEVSPSLFGAQWQPAAGSDTPSGGRHHLLLDSTSASRYFRSRSQSSIP